MTSAFPIQDLEDYMVASQSVAVDEQVHAAAPNEV